MEAIRLYRMLEKDGEIVITGLPYKKGQYIEMILLPESEQQSDQIGLTASQLLQSDLIGMWKDRDDIGDSPSYARKLREQAQRRRD